MPRFGRRDRDYLAQLSYAIFGDDNTGPGRSGGEFQNSVSTYHTPRSLGDLHCKTHDRQYAQALSAIDLENADYEYAHNQFHNPELKYKLAGAAVGAQGLARTARRKFEEAAAVFNPGTAGPSRKRLRRNDRMAEASAQAVDSAEFTPMTLMSASSSSGSNKGQETKITPIPQHVAFGIPKVYTCKHYYNTYFDFDLTTTGVASETDTGADIAIRLNSIYDVMYNQTGTQQPTWRSWAATYWEYYTVLGCDVKLRLTPKPDTTGSATDVYHIFVQDYGQITPTFASNYDSLNNDPRMTIIPMNVDSTKGEWQNSATYHKFFTYGDYDKLREVVQDASDNIWTAKAADPSLTWVLYAMPRTVGAALQTGGHRKLRWHVELTCTVQWRELNANYAFWTS